MFSGPLGSFTLQSSGVNCSSRTNCGFNLSSGNWSQSRILDDDNDHYRCLGEWMQRVQRFQACHSDFVWFLPAKNCGGSDAITSLHSMPSIEGIGHSG